MAVADLGTVQIRYDLHGRPDGPRVALFCGRAMSRRFWHVTLVPRLVDAGYRVLTLDNRGSGDTVAPPGPYTVPQLADDAGALLDRLGWQSVAVCGLSLGGMIAERVAATRPGVRAAVLLASSGTPTTFQRAVLAAHQEESAHGPYGPDVSALVELMTTVPAYALLADEPMAATMLAHLRLRTGDGRGPVDQGAAAAGWAGSDQQRAAWAAITAPALLVAFEHDILFPPHAVRAAAEEIRSARYAEVPGVAHGDALVRAAGAIGDLTTGFLREAFPVPARWQAA
ncbi:alpha/beta fold hydrolase [Winogradskya consettensis]|uniref:Hydrolase n=1 Tax=Winogradskya consettensis TaxID=113560 RepID=A0A919VJM9_9ACTN|nr:alpha/beta fold hydrolase [Actinoplanes consettensis]GIM68495.1 hydrolase [Actinoplanes consettensis]